jgi:hypothetical protein
MGANSNEVYAPMGTVADYSGANAMDAKFVAPMALNVVRLVVHYEDGADGAADNDWELFVNGVDSGVAFKGDENALDDTGYVLGANARFQCAEGDILHIVSEGADGGTTPVAYATLVLSR